MFYASEKVETAVAELSFYRLLFFAESPNTPFPDQPTDFSAFAVPVATAHAFDLSGPQFTDPALRNLTNYTACQSLADTARTAKIELLRYRSVRDPSGGFNIALLTPKAFASKKPKTFTTWRIKVGQHGVSALRDFPVARLSYGHDTFAADPRLEDLNWAR